VLVDNTHQHLSVSATDQFRLGEPDRCLNQRGCCRGFRDIPSQDSNRAALAVTKAEHGGSEGLGSVGGEAGSQYLRPGAIAITAVDPNLAVAVLEILDRDAGFCRAETEII